MKAECLPGPELGRFRSLVLAPPGSGLHNQNLFEAAAWSFFPSLRGLAPLRDSIPDTSPDFQSEPETGRYFVPFGVSRSMGMDCRFL